MFGAGITSLAVVRALGRADIPLLVAAGRPGLVQRSRWCRPAPAVAPAETPDGERIAAYLRALPLAEAVTFPTSDDWAIGLASLPRDVGDAFRATTAPADVLRTLVDKGPFASAAERSGVPIPRTMPVAGSRRSRCPERRGAAGVLPQAARLGELQRPLPPQGPAR